MPTGLGCPQVLFAYIIPTHVRSLQVIERVCVPMYLGCPQVLFAYINLLKTISMKLTVNLVGLFFHVDEEGAAFPLYTEVTKYIKDR